MTTKYKDLIDFIEAIAERPLKDFEKSIIETLTRMSERHENGDLSINPPRYRHRRGMFDKAVLQEHCTVFEGDFESSRTVKKWFDVPFSETPTNLFSNSKRAAQSVIDDINKMRDLLIAKSNPEPENKTPCENACGARVFGLRHLAAECDCKECQEFLGVKS